VPVLYDDATPSDDDINEILQEMTQHCSGGAKLQPDGCVDPKTTGLQDDGVVALLVRSDQPDVLHALTRGIFVHRANITDVGIVDRHRRSTTCFALSDVVDLDALDEQTSYEQASRREEGYSQLVCSGLVCCRLVCSVSRAPA
jgi:hypothetical protein